jgi:hypothetical protein
MFSAPFAFMKLPPMPYATIEEVQRPIFLITFSSEEPTKAEFEEYLAMMLAVYQREAEVSFIFDATQARYLPAELRIRQGLWLKENQELVGQRQKCAVFVIPNLLVRLIFDGVMMVGKFPAPYEVVKDLAKAHQVARERLGLTPLAQ